MPRPNLKNHIKIEGFTSSLPYKYPREVVVKTPICQRNRDIHGNKILRELQHLRQRFAIPEEVDLPDSIVKDDTIYVDFTSEWGYELKFESLEQNTKNPGFQIMNIRKEEQCQDNEKQYRYHVTVMMTSGGVSTFIKKIEAYLKENYINPGGVDSGNPKNYKLFNNIAIIQSATLKSFWTDAPEIPFPPDDEVIWWEVWFRRVINDQFKIRRVLDNLEAIGAQAGRTQIEFTEHYVRLVKASARQLSLSLLLLDNLSELRKPQETADFICHKNGLFREDAADWLSDLNIRTQAALKDDCVLICLLDSGVNNAHPLISPFLPDERLYSYNVSAWGTGDDWPRGGHGTGVAGLALYGDMTDALAKPSTIRIFHGLESFKIIHANHNSDPDLYAAITEEAISTPIADDPDRLRVYCMTVTNKGLAFRGRPSAWSAAVDKMAFGNSIEPKSPQLIIVSAGNVEIHKPKDFPTNNYRESVHDPGQAYNAITVGSYTRKDRIDPSTGYKHLAERGFMAPCNSTSISWESQWPIKPDIVMEGGNAATDGIFVADHHSLRLLSADAEYPKFSFIPFGDTSGATGLAAKMAAELRAQYPHFWPETIRGLIIHSAEWTPVMLRNGLVPVGEQERQELLRSVGYGVPILESALYSADNSLTLIAERYIQPFRRDGSTVKPNEFHLFELPWPKEVLLNDLFDQDVTLKVTLSYFIEPNPGSKNNRYANNFHYHSHNLDFAVIKRNEDLKVFKRRISADAEIDEDLINNTEEPWTIKRVRSRGSVKKDFITMSGAEMARRNFIAVYPKSGWYRTRKKLQRSNEVVRYSLIIAIETPITNIDLYTPVMNQIKNMITA